MDITFILIGLLLFFILTSIILFVKFKDERNNNLYLQSKFNPFTKKRSLLTGNEKKLLKLLEGFSSLDTYYIYPQLHLSTFLKVKDGANDLKGKFDWLNKLYVDFVIFDKETLSPLLVIELNDSTHKWDSRKARDEFVAKALEENGIPLLTFTTNQLASRDVIDNILQEELSKLNWITS